MNNFNKYKYFIAGNKVIAVSTYAGRKVRGVAKCDPVDTFDEEKGKKLAAARCNEKVAIKRVERAAKRYCEATAALDAAMQEHNRMREYFMDASDALDEARTALSDLAKEV